MTSRAYPQDRALLTSAINVLLAFTESGTPFAISNDSLREVLRTFDKRISNVDSPRALAMLRAWEKQASSVRDKVLPEASLISYADGANFCGCLPSRVRHASLRFALKSPSSDILWQQRRQRPLYRQPFNGIAMRRTGLLVYQRALSRPV